VRRHGLVGKEFDVLVFVYGSLMSRESLRQTVKHSVRPGFEPVVVQGWRRRWSCISAKTFVPAGSEQRVRRVVLGLERRPGSSCQGLLVQIDRDDLRLLREREAAYDVTDVTDVIVRPPGRVLTFAPREPRLRARAEVPEPLVVERGYLDSCLSGAADHDLVAARAELEDTDDLPVIGDPTEERFSWPPPGRTPR
jgi:hypothetical protein